jgi:hypothetical protein
MKLLEATDEARERAFLAALDAVGCNAQVSPSGSYPTRYEMDDQGRMIPGSEHRVDAYGEPYNPSENGDSS